MSVGDVAGIIVAMCFGWSIGLLVAGWLISGGVSTASKPGPRRPVSPMEATEKEEGNER